MGKFKPKSLSKKLNQLEKDRKERIKISIKNKVLMEEIKCGEIIIDGVLAFGSNNGRKISELLSGYDTSAYVTEYLLNDDMLPLSFRKKIKKIIDNYDPFVGSKDKEEMFSGLNVREVVDIGEIPW